MNVCGQYELVAELFHDKDDPAMTSGAKTKRGTAGSGAPLIRASKEAQKSTQQQRQLKKTVGSQVL